METLNLSKEIEKQRDWFNGFGKSYPMAIGVKIEQTYLDDVSCYWFIPNNIQADKTIIYLHGGGHIMGSVESHKAMVSHLADRFNAKILFVEYALAPENPYPAEIEDFMKVYSSLLTHNRSLKVIIIGDSAGAGLLLSSLGRMQEPDLPQPAGMIMISPWLDLECNNNSYETNESIDPIFTKSDIQKYASLYIGGGNISEANPIRNKLKKYPPALVLAGTNEVLLDDSKNFVKEIKKYQPDSTLSIYENQTHVWMLSNINTDASKKAMDEMNDFITRL